MTLQEALSEYLGHGQQGQLVVKFFSDVHLCKILIDNGKAVNISHGRNTPEAILETLPNRSVEWVNFIAGYPVRKHLDMPLHEQLLGAISGQSSVASRPAPQPAAAPQPASASQPTAPAATKTPSAPQPKVDPAEPIVEAERVADTIDSLTELIGPMGRFLAEQLAASFNYSAGNPMGKSIYNKFVSALAKEIPAEMQPTFLKKFQA